ncbi:hypothetical protein ACWOAH_03610 [Vagococcus vulneris]|uniref:Uncharacterized protein n=1 Tax=Vagococcus vulneris TaxID=1977869 RepID=A0A429ZWF2_9ENTE|nr:hypothetical protein [Vagococcus vulneris]RST98150.1 hypothetical protein CBF37_08950 [Vagococcus vulneris]
MIKLNNYYYDRGIQKYNGFYLFEHMREVDVDQKIRDNLITAETEMTESDIFEIIDYSLYKDLEIIIQLNLRDMEGGYMPDIRGKLMGYDEDYLYIEDMTIQLNQIRHISLEEAKAWYNK